MLKEINTSFVRKTLGAVALLSFFGGGSVLAQSNDNRSPYTRFGYGSLLPQVTAGARGMGSVGVGLRDGMTTSPINPASYTSVDSLTFIFDAGISLRASFLSDGKQSDSRLLGNIDYLTMLFPLGRRMAMSAGIMPYASTGYNFGNLAPLEGATSGEQSLRSYTGRGYYNTLYLGLGARPFAGLSVGANAGFLFGHTSHERQIIYQNQTAFSNLNAERLGLQGLKLDFGAQYEVSLDSLGSRSLVLGAVVTPGVSLRSEYIQTHQRIGSGSTETISSDTTTLRGAYSLPLTVGIGASYRIKNKLLLATDIKFGKWTSADFLDSRAEFQDQWAMNAGVEWQPNHRARSVLSRTKYRFGISGATSYLKVPTGNATFTGYYELAASLGLGIPLVDRRSAINIGFEYKHLMPRSRGMVTENYLGVTLGIGFNEGWFKKARVH